ncbi:MAG: endolytic transglycosylase MltG [Patescibacteria group bacterium]
MKFRHMIFTGVCSGTVVLGAYYFFVAPVRPQTLAGATDNEEIIIRIAPGSGLTDIAAELKKNKVIRSEGIFSLYSLLAGKAHTLKPGRYSIDAGVSLGGLVQTLADGPEDIAVTIVPGMTLREVDAKLSALGLIKSNELASLNLSSFVPDYPWLTKFQNSSTIDLRGGNNPEGFILPDTYSISSGGDSRAILQKFLDNFQNKALPLFSESSKPFDALIVASLLEKEAPDYMDRERIAGILAKRLRVDMPLQIDATVIYANCGGSFSGCDKNTRADYAINSPYNTYIYTGLPPKPISNPDLEAIRAALTPKASPYWFYLSDPKTKKTIFSETLDEHNDARVNYLLSK